MNKLVEISKDLLESKTVKLIIGYGEGTDNSVMAVFIRKPEDTARLIYDERCIQNLAVYLMKNEVKQLGKACIIANISSLKTILQLASEHQLKEDNIVVLGVHDDEARIFGTFSEIENFLTTVKNDISEEEKELINKLERMSREERWQFWVEQLSMRCIKCYACRAACPLCYCHRCQVEFNQPQMITVEATPLGNIEWQITRVMHLAGRCIGCGECSRACPMKIPLHLLNSYIIGKVGDNFGYAAGTKADADSVMSVYKTDDKENFIKHT